MDIKSEVKILLVHENKSMKELVESINEKYNRNDSSQNLSNKLSRNTLKYSEALEIADVLGYKINWTKKKEVE